jgi:hypothetical protein
MKYLSGLQTAFEPRLASAQGGGMLGFPEVTARWKHHAERFSWLFLSLEWSSLSG